MKAIEIKPANKETENAIKKVIKEVRELQLICMIRENTEFRVLKVFNSYLN
jgi:hypothetical protein